jgi:hypothetical protein
MSEVGDLREMCVIRDVPESAVETEGATMKISVQINVPDGEFCSGCDLWYRSENKRCYCLLFGMVELNQRYKENMVSGTDIVKCAQCQVSVRLEGRS